MLKLEQCKHGNFLYITHDIWIGRSLELYGEYSELEVQFILGLLQDHDCVVDVGANIGCLTVPIAQHVKNGRVFAFEPQRIIHQILCANIALNLAWNVHTFHMGLSDTTTFKSVKPFNYAEPGNFGDGRLTDDIDADKVLVTTLDSFELNPKLIKIDVQGMEQQVLRGSEHTIERSRPFLYVENERDDQDLVQQIQSYGYRTYPHFPPMFNVNNHRNCPQNRFGRVVSMNVLGVPKEI